MPENLTIRTVIFDIDNTLYDFTGTNRLAVRAVGNYAESRFGWQAELFEERYASVQKRILESLGMNGSCRNRILRFQTILEEAGLPLFPHVTAMYDLYWDTLLDNLTPFDGAEEAMLTAKELGLRIGICTDMTAYMQFRKLEKMNLLRYVDFMVSSEEAGSEKPAPAIFDLCVRKAGCLPGECIFIGDNPAKDIIGALDAGMQACLLTADNKTVSCSAIPGSLAVSDLREFPNILRSYAKPITP